VSNSVSHPISPLKKRPGILSLSLFMIHALPNTHDINKITTNAFIDSSRYSSETINWKSAISKSLINKLFILNIVPYHQQYNLILMCKVLQNSYFATFYNLRKEKRNKLSWYYMPAGIWVRWPSFVEESLSVPVEFLGTFGQDLIVSKFSWLHVHIFQFFFIHLR
jgi:hypothetical protein